MDFMVWILIVALCLLAVVCPFLILMYLQWMPWYVSVAFVVWVILSIAIVAFSKEKIKKWYDNIMFPLILTIGFTILFLISMDTNHYMFDDNNGLWAVAPTLSLPVYCFIGKLINDKLLARQEKKRQEYNDAIDIQVNEKNVEIRKLEKSIKNKMAIIHFVDVLEHCGEDMSQILNNPKVGNILNIHSEIIKKQNEIKALNATKK